MKDLQTGAIARVSTDAIGAQANGESYDPSISADGRYVTFYSSASNLAAGDTNGSADVFRASNPLWQPNTPPTITSDGGGASATKSAAENTTPVTTVTATDPDAFQTLTYSIVPVASGGGADAAHRFTINPTNGALTFVTAPNYEAPTDAGANNVYDVTVKVSDGNGGTDTQTIAVTVTDVATTPIAANPQIVSADNDGNVGNNDSFTSYRAATLSRRMAATSRSTAWPATWWRAINGSQDVFVKDLQTGAITRVSTTATDAQGNSDSITASISADGRYVAFYSNASNLVAGDTNGTYDVFVKDLQTGAITRVNTAADGTQADNFSASPSIRPMGAMSLSKLSRQSGAGRHQRHRRCVRERPADRGDHAGLHCCDRRAGRLSSNSASISADGRYVTFYSNASNLVAGDTNGAGDVFVKELQLATITRVSTSSSGVQGNLVSSSASTSADGRYVAFYSDANSLVAGGTTTGVGDVFVKDLQTGTVTRISTNAAGVQGNGDSQFPSISADGRYVAFDSTAKPRPGRHERPGTCSCKTDRPGRPTA